MNLWGWFWFVMVWSSVIWYSLLVTIVGYRAGRDMIGLVRSLSVPPPGEAGAEGRTHAK